MPTTMIAYVEQQRRLVSDGDAEPSDGGDAGQENIGALDVAAAAAAGDIALAARDFGGMVFIPPATLLRPSTTDDVVRAVCVARRSSRLTVAARGNGHSVGGQAMARGGVVLDMRDLGPPMELVGCGGVAADVPAGALWEEVLEWGVRNHGMAPTSWTDYLGLTVGGTLSNGGIGGQAFRHGPQVANVAELEVVTGDGERRVCSPSLCSDLFFAALGGLGQFGVITRARIPLVPAPKMVRWIRVVYKGFEEYAGDAEWLVTRADSEAFDYVEGFAFVNDVSDPVNGWGSVPILPGSVFDPAKIPAESEPILYCLELALHHNHRGAAGVDERAKEMMWPLRYMRGLVFAADVSYVDFLSRVGRSEEEARANGTWATPHPWLNILVSSSDIADFDRTVFKRILRRGVGGPMLVYPLLRSKWDPRMSVALPESEVFYLVALLRFIAPRAGDAALEEAVAQNREIIGCCRSKGYDFKVYIPRYESEADWARHFGRDWARFVERKRRYDPIAILAPGQTIFARAEPPAAAP
ncbi:unnamed protein product [Musa hybrid cultivar]